MSAPGGSPSGRVLPGQSPEDMKACCAAAYNTDAVALILGDTYHPGGLALTRRLADALVLRPGERVADIARGPGTTAFLLAGEYGVAVRGIDLSEAGVAAANAKARHAGFEDRVVFDAGDAERLLLADATVDAVVCECALCTFPDKAAAAAEMARVLKPGGRVGITDVTLDPGRLGPELSSLAGWVACIADARPVDEYRACLEDAGLRVAFTEEHDDAFAKMIETIDARLVAYGMISAPALADIDIDTVRRKVAVAARVSPATQCSLPTSPPAELTRPGPTRRHDQSEGSGEAHTTSSATSTGPSARPASGVVLSEMAFWARLGGFPGEERVPNHETSHAGHIPRTEST